MGPACQHLASTRFSSFGNTANPQIPCSRNLPATPPQQNMVSGMLLVCNRIQQNVWLLMTNICPMTEHRVSFCSISDLFPQRKFLWLFFPATIPQLQYRKVSFGFARWPRISRTRQYSNPQKRVPTDPKKSRKTSSDPHHLGLCRGCVLSFALGAALLETWGSSCRGCVV